MSLHERPTMEYCSSCKNWYWPTNKDQPFCDDCAALMGTRSTYKVACPDCGQLHVYNEPCETCLIQEYKEVVDTQPGKIIEASVTMYLMDEMKKKVLP